MPNTPIGTPGTGDAGAQSGAAGTGTNTGATPGGASGAAAGQQQPQQSGGQSAAQSGAQTQSSQGDYLGQLLAGGDTGSGDGGDGGGNNGGSTGDGGDGGQGGTGQGGGDAGGDGGETPLTRADLESAAQQIADRQVNALLKRLGMDGKNKPGGNKQQGQPSQQQQQQGQQAPNDGGEGQQASRAPVGPDPADAREARMAYREYVADQHRFVDASEREIANSLSGAAISAELAEHGDPDRAGRAAATAVAGQLTGYRKAIEKATVDELRRRGALTQSAGTAGGGSAPPGQPPAPANLADKRSAAQAAADRINILNGHPSQQAG